MANQYSTRMPVTTEEIEDRRLFVMKLRNRCHSWDEIARLTGDHVGYKISPSMCAEDYRVVMRQRAKELHEETDAHRAAMIERLNIAEFAIMEKVEAGNLDAIDLLIKLEQRRTRLLGTDAPTKHEVEDKTPRIANVEELMTRIAELQKRIGERRAAKELGPSTVIDVQVIEPTSQIVVE